MELVNVLREIDLFQGLNDEQLVMVGRICQQQHYHAGEMIAEQGSAGDELFLITDGFVEVVLGPRPSSAARVVVSLGIGQVIGEMALLDQGPRSASIRATSEPTIVQVIHRDDFETLCDQDTQIGYLVMRNLAADLSFKIRQRNLSER